MTWTGQHVLRRMRQDLFRKLQPLSLSYYAENEAGDLMSRITNDTDTIQQAFGFALLSVISGALLMVWIVIKMLQANVPYALLSLAVVPVMVVATVWFSESGAQSLPHEPSGDGQRQRRPAGEHLRRARGAGVQPRGREHRATSAAPTPPTATPTCAPSPSPAR